MLSKSTVSSALVATMVLGLLGLGGTPARAVGIPISESESNLFILDVSGSVNSAKLWESLKISIISKLEQPFGSPIEKDGKPRLPVDISVTSISKNSANSPIFNIVGKKDSREIWGAIDLAYPKSFKSRWEKFDAGFFGDKGVWTDQIKIFERPKIVIPSSRSCMKAALKKLNGGDPFLQRSKPEQKKLILGVMCEKLIKIAESLQSADAYFSSSTCKIKEICSDVIGAIYRSTSLAEDLARTSSKAKPLLCIAIASDMLHYSPGMERSSDLNSKRIAETARTLNKAKNLGSNAAKSVGIKFPTSVTTRVFMVGIGSGPDPLELERNSFLLAYWEGFWTSTGVKVSNQAKSLNRACSS
jgi:hypothetical protein